jgi:hypothetical protein
MENARTVRIVLVSPGDVGEERQLFREVIQSASSVVCQLGVMLDLRVWEDASMGYRPEDPQARIDEHLEIEKSDLVIGIFWKSPGSIGTDGQSRTEREVRRALAQKRKDGHRPEVMICFSNCAVPPTVEDAEGRLWVLRLRDSLRADGCLTKDYPEPSKFFGLALSQIVRHVIFITSDRVNVEDNITCVASTIPPTVRSHGFTERVSDIALDLYVGRPGQPDEIVSLTLALNTAVTNRIADGVSTDITLETRDDHRLLARAKLTQNNVEFGTASVNAGVLNRLLIRGIRADAVFLAISSTFARNYIRADMVLVRLSNKQALVKSLDLAYVERSFTVTIGESKRSWVGGPDAFFGATVCFRELVPGAFKTRAEERGDNGTVLAIRCSGFTAGYEIYVTARDLQVDPSGTSSDLIAKAIAVDHDVLGVPKGPALLLPSMRWPAGPPLTAVREDGVAAFEVIASHQDDCTIRELVFGVVVKGPATGMPWGMIATTLAPFYSTKAAHMASGTLPVPRFVPGSVPFNIVFEPLPGRLGPIQKPPEVR